MSMSAHTITAQPTGLPGLSLVHINGCRLTRAAVLSAPVVDIEAARMPDARFRAVAEVRTGAPYAGPDGAPVVPRCELIALEATGLGTGARLVRLVSSHPVVLGDHAGGEHAPLIASTALPVAYLCAP